MGTQKSPNSEKERERKETEQLGLFVNADTTRHQQ